MIFPASQSGWQPRVILPTRGHLIISGEILVVLTVERLLLAVRTKPGMLLNILQYTGQSPTNNSLVEDVKSAEVETPKQVKTSSL